MLAENGQRAAAASGKRFAQDAPGGGGKRRRSGGPEAAFDDLIEQGGCQLESSRDGSEYEVEDPRKLRRMLEQKLTLNVELRANFLAGLQQQLADTAVLHAALKPMSVTGNCPITGDSFVRVLLNVTSLQADVSQLLLERLPEFCDAQGEEAPLPQLILGQFRWLDHVADPHALTTKLLEVLPVCPEELKKDAITFLPEIATEDNHESVIMALDEMMGQDSQYILPSIEAMANLCLTADQQERVVEMVMQRFQSADAEDLPAVSRFLLQHAAQGAALKKVVSMLRESLHFVSASDPRLAVPDRKQKGKVLGGSENPELRVLEALKQAMQLNPAAADAVVKEIRGVTEPESHRVLDLWLLLAMLTLGADRRKAAEMNLRRKFAEGHAQASWLQKGIAGHEAAMLEYFPQLLSLAQQLLRHAAEPVQRAGAELYILLYSHFTEAYNQQEVLRALHSHLGAQVATEATAALQVLLRLSQEQTGSLMRYAAFLTNILDYLDAYTDQQVHQVFAMFSELVAGACQQADEEGSGGGSDSGGRSRMEDELMIFVRKQLSSAQGQHRRVGIIGTVALVQRLGAATSDALESETAIGRRYKEAMSALKETFDTCQRSPEGFAFLCDELSRGIQRKTIGRRLMEDVHAMTSNYLEETFCCFLEEDAELTPADSVAQVGGQRLESELWWNLDGKQTPVALRLLPLISEELAPGSNSAPLLPLFATIRLMAALQVHLKDTLENVVALLGCPFNLFSTALADPHQFGSQPADLRRCVLLGTWYALNWCRELTNCFGGQLGPNGHGAPEMQMKLFARLRCCCQLEALLDVLLQHAPPLFVLPTLGNTLIASQGGMAAVAAAAKPAAGKGAGKGKGKGGGAGKKKKAVQFAAGDDDNVSGGGRGGATSQHTTSGGGASRAHTDSGSGSHTQAGAPSATQSVATAVVGGLGRLAPERCKQRSLLLPALRTLGVGASAEQDQPPCYAMLPAAAYILADLHSKLKVVLVNSKRPGFPGRPSRNQLPADLCGLTAAELLQALAPVLPSIRRHLDAACNIIDQGLTDEDTEQHDREQFWDAGAAVETSQLSGGTGGDEAAFLVPLDNTVATAALSPCSAASRVRTLALDCVQQLLAWPGLAEPANRPVLQALLSAFLKDGPQAPADGAVASAEQLADMCRSCFTHFAAQSPELKSGEPALDSLSHQHACLLIMDSLLTLLNKVQPEPTEATASLPRRMGKRITRAAEAMLKQVTLDAEGKEMGSAAWKGRGPLLADVLRLHLSHSSSPLEALLALAQDCLPQVPGSTSAKDAVVCVDPYPSLSGNTISVWYRVCFEQLQAAWDSLVVSAVGAEKQRGMLEDEGIMGQILEGMQFCASAFNSLLQVVKVQTQRVAIHVQAVKSGGKFLETFFKSLPFWAAIFKEQQGTFQAMVKDMQKGTRVLQTLCSEGKYRKEMPLTAKVPQVKRTVERFVFLIKAFLTEVNAGSAFWLGSLKHRDLTGREVPSQMYTEEAYEDDAEEGEDEEGYGDEQEEEEEMGETQGDGDY